MALSIVLAGTATGVTFALWHATATVDSTASSADLELTTTGFDSLGKTFANHTLSTTGSFTVKNNTVTPSSQQATFTVSLGYTGDAALASNLGVATWPTSTPSTCAATQPTPPTAVSGTWAAFPADPAQALTGNLAKQQSASYCVRVTAAERGLVATADGELVIQPNISATLGLGGWSDSASASTTQKTAWIFPAYGPTANTWYHLINQGSGKCVDINGAATASGTPIIDFGCKNDGSSGDYNQHWKFTRSTGDYFDITSRNPTSVRLDLVDGSSQGAVNMQTDAPARVSQEWQVQTQPGGVYQVVNRLTGFCLQPSSTLVYNGNPQYVAIACDGSSAQRFTLTSRGVDVPVVSLTCEPAAYGAVTYRWTGNAVGGYAFTAQHSTGGALYTLSTAPEGATSVTVLPGQVLGADGQYTVTSTWNGYSLDTEPLWKTTTAGTAALSCSSPLPKIDTMDCVASGSGSGQIVTCSISPAATQSYTVEAATVSSTGAVWSTVVSGATGSSFVITGGGQSDLALGDYNIRVRDGAGNLLNNAWRITINSETVCNGYEIFGYCVGGGGWQTYKYPSNPTTATPSFSCYTTGSNNNRRVSYSWDLQYPGSLTFQARNGSTWTNIATGAVGVTAQAVTSNPPLNWSNNTYQVRVLNGSDVIGSGLQLRVYGNGNNKYIQCT